MTHRAPMSGQSVQFQDISTQSACVEDSCPDRESVDWFPELFPAM